MEPLRGRAEQISARTAAVMNMKIIEMMYDDLYTVVNWIVLIRT